MVSLAPSVEKVFPVKSPLGRIGLACAIKRSYAIGGATGGKLSLADVQVPLVLFQDFERTADGERRALLDDSDMLPVKDVTDVVLRGSAHAPERTRELYAGLSVSGFARRLRVVGERIAEVSAAGEVRFSSPEPFERLALDHRVAYGGYDAYAHEVLDPPPPPPVAAKGAGDLGPDLVTAVPSPRYPGIFAYPRNHAGVGYFIDLDRRRADGAALPQVEDPEDMLTPERFFVPSPTAWIDAPIPGSFGWVAPAWYPRILRCAGPLLACDEPARPLREAALGDGDDLVDPRGRPIGLLHPRALNGASPGLARERLRGNEPVVLENLSARAPHMSFLLPGEQPRFSVRPPGLGVMTPKPVLQTLRIEPDHDRVILTWIGVLPLAAAPPADFVDRTELSIGWTRID
ncbi:MAG: DUF2169 domain-containing protein [Byssovorax sp.]